MPIISLLQRLQQTPQTLGLFLSNYPNTDRLDNADNEEWHINDVLFHLGYAEEKFLARFKKMASQNNTLIHLAIFTAEDQTILKSDQTAEQLLADFTRRREKTIQFLKSLPPEKWKNIAYHPSYGQASLHFHVQNMFSHDREHINQAQKIADKSQQVQPTEQAESAVL